jgi:hypothetical protein
VCECELSGWVYRERKIEKTQQKLYRKKQQQQQQNSNRVYRAKSTAENFIFTIFTSSKTVVGETSLKKKKI